MGVKLDKKCPLDGGGGGRDRIVQEEEICRGVKVVQML
jgi:hypothetical protein